MASTAIRSLPIPLDSPSRPFTPAPSLVPLPIPPAEPAPETSSQQLRPTREPLGTKFWAALGVGVAHLLLLIAAFTYRHHVTAQKTATMQVVMLPPMVSQQTEQEQVPEFTETPPVVPPPPVFEIRERPPTITAVVMETPPVSTPPKSVTVRKAVTAESPAPVSAPEVANRGDLAASMASGIPPRYPIESRRLKEQGTVILDVLVGESGMVETIKIQTSSGYQRLDQAALQAVRKWKWHPFIQNGQPMKIRGVVEIPFVLKKRD